MWAARLCAAIEDQGLGEELTSEILGHAELENLLPKLRQAPHKRQEVLGEPVPLATWVQGDPDSHVIKVLMS
jgi:hypothetical protein